MQHYRISAVLFGHNTENFQLLEKWPNYQFVKINILLEFELSKNGKNRKSEKRLAIIKPRGEWQDS